MKKLVLLIVFCLTVIGPSLGHSSPFLVCEPYPVQLDPSKPPQPSDFVISESGKPDVVVTPQTLGDNSVRLYYDVAGYSVGNHNLSVKARKDWGVYGVKESAPAPFVLSVPSALPPEAPASIGLTK